jgi:hypothetical protein
MGVMLLLCLGGMVFAQKGDGMKGKKGNGAAGVGGVAEDVRSLFKTDVPNHEVDVILGRPTDSSVTVSVCAYREVEGIVEYGAGDVRYGSWTEVFGLGVREAIHVELRGLSGREQWYRLGVRERGKDWRFGERQAFRLQARRGDVFRFGMQADSHLDYNTDPELYLRCLENVRTDRPDFMIDLGDTFMTDKHRGRETAESQYYAQRYYFGRIGAAIPWFLVLGNHDGESRRLMEGSDPTALWALNLRKRLYANPEPGAFYTGNREAGMGVGWLQDYYAWEWGDALFVVLDPFWYSPRQRGGEDNWVRTLGRDQYEWLKHTLEGSRATFRFVFLHHLVGGIGREARGGREAARLYEWGGRDEQGLEGFSERRRGWAMPIHELLVRNRVNAVFHGHDHLYVKEDLDGVVYQSVPQPGHPRYDQTRSAEEYGYRDGTILGSSGYLRVSVDRGSATVEYVRAVLERDEGRDRKNGAVSHRYALTPR